LTEIRRHQGVEGDTEPTVRAGAALVSHARLILAVVIAAAFLDVVDFSVVQVALPTIQREFLAPLAESQWVTGVYGLTLAGFLMVSGRAGDVYGQKRLFLFGIVLFTVSSLSAGLAPSLLSLVVSRAIQGIAAAMTTATALAILAATFPEGKERNRAFGVLVSILSAGFAAGSIAGGVLTAAFGWRSVMFVNVPIGAVATILAQRFIARNGPRATSKRLDIPGAVTVTAGLILLVYAFTIAATDGLFTVQAALPLGLSALTLAAFLAIEYRSKAPLMPLAFLRRRTTLTANVLSLVVSSSAGALIVLTVYLQGVLGYSPLDAGLAFLPAAAIFFFVGGWGSSWLMNRIGLKRVLVISTAFVTLGRRGLSRHLAGDDSLVARGEHRIPSTRHRGPLRDETRGRGPRLGADPDLPAPRLPAWPVLGVDRCQHVRSATRADRVPVRLPRGRRVERGRTWNRPSVPKRDRPCVRRGGDAGARFGCGARRDRMRRLDLATSRGTG